MVTALFQRDLFESKCRTSFHLIPAGKQTLLNDLFKVLACCAPFSVAEKAFRLEKRQKAVRPVLYSFRVKSLFVQMPHNCGHEPPSS
jgi:hypothetical protein